MKLAACLAVVAFAAACIGPPPERPTEDSRDTGRDAQAPGLDAADLGPVRDVEASRPDADMQVDAGPPRRPTVRQACKALYQRGERSSGVYAFESPNGMIELRCQMEVAGGGWTLIGRSVAGANSPMGWTTNTGDPNDTEVAYSVAAKTLEIRAEEFLVTNHDGTFEPGAQRHRGFLPTHLYDPECASGPCETSNVVYVAGQCQPQDYAYMFSWAGYTDQSERFFFRDNEGESNYGLHAYGWNTREDCDWGGGLDDKPGMLFVR